MNPTIPRRQWLGATLALCLSGLFGPAMADNDTPVRLIVTFPPGGSTDIAARTFQPRLAEVLGRAVVVENRPGAASQIATQFVANSAPDGNTLLVSFDSHAINPIAKAKLPYDTFKDFAGVTLAVRFPLVIGASASVQAKDLRSFIEQARQQPAKYSYASTGVGSMNQLVMEDIKRKAGVSVLHVPFGGGGPAIQAVLGDVSQITLLSYAALKGQIAAGKIKPLAVTGASRLPDLPDVPTVAEFLDRHLRSLRDAGRGPGQADQRLPDHAQQPRCPSQTDPVGLRGHGHRWPRGGPSHQAGIRTLGQLRAGHRAEVE